MKFEVRSSKREASFPFHGRSEKNLRAHRRIDHRPIDDRPSTVDHSRRRGSVLVLVMTLLGILFVLGVAFLASMNFEADMVAAQRVRDLARQGVTGASVDVGAALRDTVTGSGSGPFGDGRSALSATTFAELPGVQSSFSPIEPIRNEGPDGIPFNADDRIGFNGYFDAKGLRAKPFKGPSIPPGFWIDSGWPVGTVIAGYTVSVPGIPPNPPTTVPINLKRCSSGPFQGKPCDFDADCKANPGDPAYRCEGIRVGDADGDGIVDSILVDATEIGITGSQRAELSAQVNASENTTGRVWVALRVIPHGGMVNLNDSHPTLIQEVLGLPRWPASGDPPDPDLGYFVHRPTQRQSLYSPILEESSLRRRGFLPPRAIPVSPLQGSAFLDPTRERGGLADMAWYLYPPSWPGGANQGVFEDVYAPNTANARSHRYWPLSPSEGFAGDPDYLLWPVRMEPFTSGFAAADIPSRTKPEYDRRHLVTTVGHDDLFSRGGTISTPGGEKDIRELMIEANHSAWDPDFCPGVLPFEYADYPPYLRNETDPRLLPPSSNEVCDCPTSVYCRFNARKGRLQVSLPWIDEELARADAITDLVERENARQRVYHVIHDAFYMLVRNAAARVKVEGMSCESDWDCPASGTVCLLRGVAPPSGQRGYCVHLGNPNVIAFTDPGKSTGAGCATAGDCAIGGSVCVSGVCELAAPAWRDETNPALCKPDEFFLVTNGSTVPPTGFCADRWTRQRRSEALISRTAASLTANMIDFADAGSEPTRVAIRDFEFTKKCFGGSNHYLSCAGDADCPGGACRNLVGRDIDLDPNTNGVQGIYVYGLERQPYISEVATFAIPSGLNEISGWAVEILNPYPQSFGANDYYIYEVDPAGTPASAHVVALSGNFAGGTGANPPPFTTFYTIKPPATVADLFGSTQTGTSVALSGLNGFTFKKDWTLYLVRRITYAGDANPTDIVVDQFTVTGDHIGMEASSASPPCSPTEPCLFSVERVVPLDNRWTGTVPWIGDEVRNGATLGNWNHDVTNPKAMAIHPVEIQFADTGKYGPKITDPNHREAFPTTGSLALLMRHANRAITDYAPPPIGSTAGKAADLAFTTALNAKVTVSVREENPPGSGIYPSSDFEIRMAEQIDNGRMPLFDAGKDFGGVWRYAHHLSPRLFKRWDPATIGLSPPVGVNALTTATPLPGDLSTLPWGQLVFDYFTALPLSGAGPYLVNDPDLVGAAASQPRVDRDGARVHGRININAAPWTVLSGLPFVPMNRIPADVRDRVATTLAIPSGDFGKAFPIGPELAQAIVAYREGRALPGPGNASLTGDYGSGLPAAGVALAPDKEFARGWTAFDPAARRGTGFMGVGELANVRHPGAAPALPPTTWPHRFDYGVIDNDPGNNNDENFISAAAALIALGDWVTARSQVFTVYGQIRGEPAAGAANPVQDADSRAIRFQETIDRLPALLGEPGPKRIGERTVSKAADHYND